jgi:hypothetical protein
MWNRPAQKLLEGFASNGLFTSSTSDPDWASGHGLLPRAFNTMRVKGYFFPMSALRLLALGGWVGGSACLRRLVRQGELGKSARGLGEPACFVGASVCGMPAHARARTQACSPA